MSSKKRVLGSLAAVSLPLLAAGCATQEGPVSYQKQVRPLLEQRCLKCHVPGGAGYEKSGLDMRSHEALLKGTKFGPVIRPGDSVSSTLVLLISGKGDPSIRMPHGDGEPLSQEQIGLITRWVDQGAKNN